MPSSDYYRRQADICLKYARATDRGETSARLIALAEEYNAKAALARGETDSISVDNKSLASPACSP
jgi:hypothetical protein